MHPPLVFRTPPSVVAFGYSVALAFTIAPAMSSADRSMNWRANRMKL